MADQTDFDFNAWQRTQPWGDETPAGRVAPHRHLLAKHRVMPRLVCVDGFSMSAQASEYAYCAPRQSKMPHYWEVEVGYPSEKQGELMEWAEDADDPTGTVYGGVPVEVVNAIIAKHGGLARA